LRVLSFRFWLAILSVNDLAFKQRLNKHETSQKTYRNWFYLTGTIGCIRHYSLLAGIVGPQVMKHMGESKPKAAKVQIEDLAAALDMYKLDLGHYPSSERV